MHHYFIRYFEINTYSDSQTEHTGFISLNYPIEYAEDCIAVQNNQAKIHEVSPENIMLMDWKELKGETRC